MFPAFVPPHQGSGSVTQTRKRRPPVIAYYGDLVGEMPFGAFRGALAAVREAGRGEIVDYGIHPPAPEESSAVPPWTGCVDAALADVSTIGDPRALAAWLALGGVPTVVMGADLVGTSATIVCSDWVERARLASQHLAGEVGCRSFVFVSYKNSLGSRLREEAFCDEVARLGHKGRVIRTSTLRLSFREDPRPLDDQALREALVSLPRPVGVLGLNDAYAQAVVATCRNLGLTVPGEVAVMGDRDSLEAHVHHPRITSIRVDAPAIGASALKLLLKLVDGERPPAEPVRLDGGTVFARESTVGLRTEWDVTLVDQALKIISQKACIDISVDQLAVELGVSRRLLEQRFKEQLVESPSEVIQRVRFAEASRLLVRTRTPVGQVAELVGYREPASLTKLIRRLTEMSPSDLRHPGVIDR